MSGLTILSYVVGYIEAQQSGFATKLCRKTTANLLKLVDFYPETLGYRFR
jgi:hypothetical protein